MKISHHKLASSLLLIANWVLFNRPMNGCSSLANTAGLCSPVGMALKSLMSAWLATTLVFIILILSVRAKISCRVRSAAWTTEVNMEKFMCVVVCVSIEWQCRDTKFYADRVEETSTLPLPKKKSVSYAETQPLVRLAMLCDTPVIPFKPSFPHPAIPLSSPVSIKGRRNTQSLLFVWSSVTMPPNQTGLN